MTWLKQISAWTSRPRLLKHRPFSSWTTHSSPVWYSDGSAHHTVNCKPCVSIKKNTHWLENFPHLDHFWAALLLSLKLTGFLQSARVFCLLLWSHSTHTSFPAVTDDCCLQMQKKTKKKKHISSLRERVLTKAGTTSFTGVEEEYLWAFFAANFSVGIDFPANLSLRPSTCLQTTFQWLYLLIQTK